MPVLLFYIPERAQAALAAMPASIRLGLIRLFWERHWNRSGKQHGVRFFDATKAFAAAPDFQSLFYLTDGHPQAGGHAVLAGVVEQALAVGTGVCRVRRISAR